MNHTCATVSICLYCAYFIMFPRFLCIPYWLVGYIVKWFVFWVFFGLFVKGNAIQSSSRFSLPFMFLTFWPIVIPSKLLSASEMCGCVPGWTDIAKNAKVGRVLYILLPLAASNVKAISLCFFVLISSYKRVMAALKACASCNYRYESTALI